MDLSFKLGGLEIKPWMVAASLSVASATSGAVYFGYDLWQRFQDMEEQLASLEPIQEAIRVNEQALQDQANESTLERERTTAELSEKLATVTASMQQLLEQQKVLLDLRSDVDRAITITNSIGDKLDTYDTEINDIWNAYDSLVENPLGN